MDLHKAIKAAYKLENVRLSSFRPQQQGKGWQPIKYVTNKTKTTAAMWDVKLEDTGFAAKGTLIYTLAEPRVAFSCRTLRVMNEETPEPQVVRSSGSSFDFRLGMQRFIGGLEEKVLMMSTQEAAGKATGLPEKTKRILAEYFLAASNLHGLVPIETIHQFYNSNNPPLEILAFTMFGIMLSHRDDIRFYILDKKGKVVGNSKHELNQAHYIADYTVVESNSFSYMLSEQDGKPYYLPCNEDFLLYADQEYMEENEYFLSLRSYLLNLGLDAEKARECMLEVIEYIRFYETNPHEFLEILEEHKIYLKDLKEVNCALSLYSNLTNNTRIHLNSGHTPKEIVTLLRKKSGGKNVRTFIPAFGPDPLRRNIALQSDDFDLPEGDAPLVQIPRRVEKKPGRNESCPCGSGNKFKHCCGKSGSYQSN